jgi:8-oxo-dGTP diphosphatase
VTPVVGVGAVVVDHDRLLLVRRGRAPQVGVWSIPGGKVEHGELLMEAVVRELQEETGLEGVCGPMLGWGERIDDEGHYVLLDFEVTLVGSDQPVAGDDAVEAAWVDLHEVAELDLVDGLAEFLHDHGIIATFT